MDSFRAAVQANLSSSIIGTPAPKPEPAPNPEPAPSPTPETPATSDYILYNVKYGDTLWAIARDRLGTGTRYREIMTLNGLLTDKLRLGQVLKLPE